jgi:hypothetical protein
MTETAAKEPFCMNCGKPTRYNWKMKKWTCTSCGASQDGPAPELTPKFQLSSIASILAVIGFALFGGIYLEIPALIIAIVAMYRKEGKAAWTALLISLGCIVGSVVLGGLFAVLLRR